MAHQSIHTDTPKVVYLYEDVPREALKSASARLKGSTVSKWAESSCMAPSRARNATSGSSSSESTFVYPGNDLAANIEKADGFYDSTWKPLNAGEEIATKKENGTDEEKSSNAIPIPSNHNRSSSWITMDSDNHSAPTASASSAYVPNPSYHSPSPSSQSVPLPAQSVPTSIISPPEPSVEPEDPWAAWTSSNTTATGEDAYLSRKTMSTADRAPSSLVSSVSTKVGNQASGHAIGAGSSGRGTAGRGRGRGKADLLAIKGSSASRASKSPSQVVNDSPVSAAALVVAPPSPSPSIHGPTQPATTSEDADPWAAWSPASNAVTGEAARKARELATKAGKSIVEKNIVKAPSLSARNSVEPAPAKNQDLSKQSGPDTPIPESASLTDQKDQKEVPSTKVVSGWTTIDTETPSSNTIPDHTSSARSDAIAHKEAVQVHEDFLHLALGSNETAKNDTGVPRQDDTVVDYPGLLVDLAESDPPKQILPVLLQGKDFSRKMHSPTSSFASFHSIEDDGMANIPVLKPSSSSSSTSIAIQQNGGSSPPKNSDKVTVIDDRQVLEAKLKDLSYAGPDVTAVAGLLCSLPKSNLRKCLADDAFLRRKAEEAMRILQADDEEEEEL